MRTYILRWLTLTALLLSPFGQVLPAYAANPFSDVTTSTPYTKAISVLKSDNVLQGYADGSFRPATTINRAELLKIIYEAKANGKTITGSNCFPDIQKQWFAPYVCSALADGVVSGYDDGLFRPDQSVTFAEAAKIFVNAYGEKANEYGSDWYVAFVRALEGSKAIPPSISTFDKRLTRGEMAEIMWRLSKNITNQPSVGYLNVKYPGLAINLSSDTVQNAKSCADLQAFSNESSNQQRGWGVGGGMMQESMNLVAPTASPVPQNAKSMNEPSDGSYSHTNVQVQGVDESDIVKTDGNYLYVVSGNRVRIVRAVPTDNLKQVSELTTSDASFTPSELYVSDNRLVVIGSTWSSGSSGDVHIQSKMVAPSMYPYYPSTQRAQARIFDVSDRTNPKLERTVTFDGSTVSTRMIGSKLTLVLNQPMRWLQPMPLTNLKEADILPQYADSKDGDAFKPVSRCDGVAILPRIPNPQYLTVGVIDVSKPTSEVHRTVVLGNAENVYASTQNLYVASPEWIYHWGISPGTTDEKTNLFRFAFTADGVELKAQGSVPGRILNQFSMDENGSSFRIATTVGQSWDAAHQSTNNLYVLNLSLETVGKIEDIATGEQIYSVRFLGDRAYMVTFKTVDPLFVIDTSDPRNPKILGKLKIPGYSTYLHPYDATHIIGFGKDVDESIDKDKVHDANAVYYTAVQGLKMAMFDVSDVENPKELWHVVIGDRGTDSPLLTNHKALLFEKEQNLLSFPVSVSERTADQDVTEQGKPTFQGAYVYEITASSYKLRGTISHYDASAYLKAGDYWYDQGYDVQRVVRIGTSLYTISNGAVQSNALTSLTEQGRVDFPVDTTTPQPCGRGGPCFME